MDIRLFSYRGAQVVCSPSVLALALLACIFDMWLSVLVAFISLTLHEISHTIIAKALGMRIDAVEIQPFGFVARFSGKVSVKDEFAIAATGPLFSLMLSCILAYLSNYFVDSRGVIYEFIRFNVMLSLINLLPALPLDGGRMISSALEQFTSSARAFKIALCPGFILSAFLTVSGIYIIAFMHILNITPLVMGVFLFIAAVNELKNSKTKKLSAFIKRSDIINHGRSLPLRYTAMHRSVAASDALRNLSFNRYNMITVVDENMKKIGELDESALLNGICANGNNVTIGELLKT